MTRPITVELESKATLLRVSVDPVSFEELKQVYLGNVTSTPLYIYVDSGDVDFELSHFSKRTPIFAELLELLEREKLTDKISVFAFAQL